MAKTTAPNKGVTKAKAASSAAGSGSKIQSNNKLSTKLGKLKSEQPIRKNTDKAPAARSGSKKNADVLPARAHDQPARSVPHSDSTREAAPPPLPEPAMTTDGKPRKNQAGMHSRELDHYRDLLLEKRRELLGDMSSMEREALRTGSASNLSTLPIHMADMGTDNYEQEFTLGLVEKDRTLLREINRALAKIQNGTFGICEGTGKPIGKPRLEAQPWARFSIEHARHMERGGRRF